jgi:hypothetical protein
VNATLAKGLPADVVELWAGLTLAQALAAAALVWLVVQVVDVLVDGVRSLIGRPTHDVADVVERLVDVAEQIRDRVDDHGGDVAGELERIRVAVEGLDARDSGVVPRQAT